VGESVVDKLHVFDAAGTVPELKFSAPCSGRVDLDD